MFVLIGNCLKKEDSVFLYFYTSLIICSVEKDPYDSNQKVKESQDTSYKIVDLQKKLDSARGQVKKLQGVEYSKEDQLQNLENLRNQLKLKRELLLKYRNMCSFDMFKI
ncbi:mediator of RNA polymerase II transcription subunit 9 isoform X2 [Leptopilina boulardi]|uniref:mediator of RNA polymerase II transcription subunit 9 isoform X2 n=1 Tax=Leptopilina boulardi TaxID=63433 RepID=UPI0021F5BF6A|nr:mediator of RNA polymerase II transcription subunit 9 isoform X2 [Leptopilina boulardi]